MTIPFTLEPAHRVPNFISRSVNSYTSGNELAIKVMRIALWTITFVSLGFAFNATALKAVICLYAIPLVLSPLTLEVQCLYDEIICREFNTELSKVAGDLEAIPTIEPPEGGLEKICSSHLTQRVVKGTLLHGHPFFAYKTGSEGDESIECFYRDHSFTWRKFKPSEKQENAGHPAATLEDLQKIFSLER